jgi:hypothetical protein
MVERKHLKLGLALAAAVALVIGFSVGFSQKNARRSSSSASMAEGTSAYDCDDEGAGSSSFTFYYGKSGKSSGSKGSKSSGKYASKGNSGAGKGASSSKSGNSASSYVGSMSMPSSIDFGRRLDEWEGGSSSAAFVDRERRRLGSTTRGEEGRGTRRVAGVPDQ